MAGGLVAAFAALVVSVTAGLLIRSDLRAVVDDRLADALADDGALLVMAARNEGGVLSSTVQRIDRSVGLSAPIDDAVVVIGSVPDEIATRPHDPGVHEAVVDGVRWRFLDRLITRPVGAPLEPRASVPIGDVQDSLIRIRRSLAAALALAVVSATVVGGVLGRRLAQPIEALADDVDELVPERGTTPIPEPSGPPEVARLARRVNDLQDRIDDALGELSTALDVSRSFAASVSHELRTPLTAARADLDALARHPDLDPAERATIAADALASLDAVSVVLDALRMLGRGDLDAVDVTAFDLGRAVERAVAAVARSNPDTTIDWEPPTDTVEVTGWEEGIVVAVTNLVANAVTHGAGTHLAGDRHDDAHHVRGAHHDGPHHDGSVGDSGRVRVGIDVDGGSVSVVVEDRGPGIAVDDRARLLQRFERGDTVHPGSGLGLALVAQQAELHDGTVTIDDRAGGGARIALTVKASPSSVGGPVHRSSGPTWSAGER